MPRILHRPARMLPAAVPTGDVPVPQPPPEQAAGFSWWPQLLFPLVTLLGSAFFVVYNPNPLYIAISGTMALASVGLSAAMVFQQRSAARRRAAHEHARYRAYLVRLAGEAREIARRQDEAGRFVHPRLVDLWAIACRQVRVWERRLNHPDFATVRIGRGPGRLATRLVLAGDADPMSERDPTLVAEARRVIEEHGVVEDQPVTVDLGQHPVLSLVGPPPLARSIARAVVTELATLCAPDDLTLAICRPAEAAPDWEFAKWLPHAAAGGACLVFEDELRMLDALADELARRRERLRRQAALLGGAGPGEGRERPLLLVLDGFSAASPTARSDGLDDLAERARDLGVVLLFLVEAQKDEPPAVDARARLEADGSFVVDDVAGATRRGRIDETPVALCEAIARQVAPLRLGEREASHALSETCRLVELLGFDSARAVDVPGLWARRPAHDLLRVPVGVRTTGQPEILDLKEAALDGMGPHGLVVGATGSGKSELLRTLVTALAATHPTDLLAFVLVDFKGGAAFAGLSELPHVAGTITNLADDLTMVDRMHAALFGEMQRRQALLRDAGNLDGVRDYQRRWSAGQLPGRDPLPHLLVIVDEFGELLASRPEFIDLFVAIGRVGRSLGMHLLLASQRLEQGRLRGLDSHLSYRICLRTFSPAESQAAIGTPDAYHLPTLPGSAYLQVSTALYERFKAALVSAPDRPAVEPVTAGPEASPFTALPAQAVAAERTPAPAPPRDDSALDEATEMSVLVDRVRAIGADHVHQVWLPPLPPRLPLARLLPALAPSPDRGLQSAGWPEPGSLRVPIGLVDLPTEQAQRPFAADLGGWAGHLVVVGAPQSGKSTVLSTLLLSLLATHTPDEARAYVVDYGGGSLFALGDAPHVGGVAGRTDVEKVRRTIDMVWSLMDERDARFRDLGIDSTATLRARRAQGSVPPDVGSDVFLFIDGWGAVVEDIGDQDLQVRDIAARGLRAACHLVLTANRWNEVRPNLRDNIGGRLELRLNDPAESEMNRRAAAALPAGVPGRALTPDANQLQVAVPDLHAGVEEVVAAAAAAWRGAPAPRVRMLPAAVSATELPGPGQDRRPGVPIGVDELELAPVHLDLGGADPHFVIFGDSESGKTTLLRTWLQGLQARHGAGEAMVLLVDYRRSLLGAVEPDQLWAYAGAAPAAVTTVRELADGIIERLPPATLQPDELAARSWWSGPDFYVVVDDYDLVATTSGSPLLPLVELLPQGRDLGLHVVVARRVGGMARGGLEPLVGRLRELHAPGILLSGDPTEGPILGMHRATAQPPGRGLLVRRRQRPVLVQAALPRSG